MNDNIPIGYNSDGEWIGNADERVHLIEKEEEVAEDSEDLPVNDPDYTSDGRPK